MTKEEIIKIISYRLDNMRDARDILKCYGKDTSIHKVHTALDDYEARIDELETLLEVIKS